MLIPDVKPGLPTDPSRTRWNKGKLIGTKPPLRVRFTHNGGNEADIPDRPLRADTRHDRKAEHPDTQDRIGPCQPQFALVFSAATDCAASARSVP